VGVFFLDLFCGGIVICFSAETRVGANVGGSQNRKESPNTRVTKGAQFTKVTKRRQRIFESLYSPQKFWTPLHVPSRPLL
jgi:hypothetical protein